MAITARPNKPISEVVNNYTQGAAAAGGRWLDGVKNPRVLFNANPANAQKAWENGINQALAAKSYQKGLASVDLSQMEATLNALGAGVYTSGINAKSPKFAKAAEVIVPAVQAIAAKVRAMPSATLQDRIARMTMQVTESAKLRGLVRGR